MALSEKFSTTFGIELDKAYMRVGSVSGNKNHVDVVLHIFANKTTAENGGSVMAVFRCGFKPEENGKTWDAQAYAHLKTLPEFAGATDC
jgi:hypothetical protein